ncbi:MAG: zinc ribbon domain-containing protein [Acidobacteriia bacterium]|nr:zinc ribbon domain-containing protein [Terriglobia bacterium]
MKRFMEALRIVPRVAWLIGALAYLGLGAFSIYVSHHDPNMREWPSWGRALFFGLMPLLVIPYVALVGYVYADARRRGMRYVVWMLLAIFIPNALGIILYFVLRDPLMSPCPQCATLVKHGFAFCPKCGTAVARACPQCRRAVEPDWSHCAACGTALAR